MTCDSCQTKRNDHEQQTDHYVDGRSSRELGFVGSEYLRDFPPDLQKTNRTTFWRARECPRGERRQV